MKDFVGFDGNGYKIGDRVQIHPGTDLWMKGVRYGVVIGSSATDKDRVRVQMDNNHRYSGSEDTFAPVGRR